MDKIFSKCLLASDVDDTLLCSNIIPKRNIEAISVFEHAGGHFCLSSGRCHDAVKLIISRLNSVRFAVTLNGAYIYDFIDNKVVSESVFTEEEKKLSYEVIERYPEICVVVYSGKKIYTVNKNRTCEVHDNYESLSAVDVSADFLKSVSWNKVSYMLDKPSSANLIHKVADDLGGFNLVDCSANIYGEFFKYVEQPPAGVSKATALKNLCKYLDVKKGDFYSIGDYYNDYEMLKCADISATTADAPDDIKKIVNFIGGKCKDGAVADFIEYLITTKGREFENGQ